MSKKIEIMDTTLRDGEQTIGVSFTPDEKLAIAKSLLLDLNVDSIEIGSARVSEGEFEAARRICAWAQKNDLTQRIGVLGFVDGAKSVEWIEKAGCKILNLLCKGSLEHVTKQLKKTPEEHAKDINNVIEYAKKNGIATNVYLEDVSNGLLKSKDYVFFLLDNIRGAERIMLPDTLGIWNPDQTYKFCKEIVEKYGDKFDFHAHNDYGLAVANSLSSINAGITRIHTTVNGLGERTGNCALSSVVAVIHDHTTARTNINEQKLTLVSKLVESLSGVRLAPNAPIVGENVYTQCCGVHADGDKKGNLYFNKILPERFGGQRVYALGKTSGRASIENNLAILGIELDETSRKKVLDRVVELGDKKETINLSDLPYIVADVLGESIKQEVKLLSFSSSVGLSTRPCSRVTLSISGKDYTAAMDGDGQYDSFMKCITSIYGQLGIELPKLLDYTVRIPPGGKTDALVETVITWESDGTFKTRGVDSDQTMAAIKATMNMLNRAP